MIVNGRLQCCRGQICAMMMVFGQILDHVENRVPLDHGGGVKVFSYGKHHRDKSAGFAGTTSIGHERAIDDLVFLDLEMYLHRFPARAGHLGGRSRFGQSSELDLPRIRFRLFGTIALFRLTADQFLQVAHLPQSFVHDSPLQLRCCRFSVRATGAEPGY